MTMILEKAETKPILTSEEPLLYREDKAGVTTLTLNRPKQFNALSQAMLSALQTELDDIAANDAIRVVVLAAAGKAFCAGHDLKEMRSHTDYAFQKTLFDQCSKMMLTINQLPQPVIAKVQGLATAAGCQLVATCDLAVAAEEAQFATPGVNIGLFCSTPMVALSRNVPRKRAMEMLLLGEMLPAREAAEYGLVNRVVPRDRVMAEALAMANQIAAKSSLTVAIGKEAFYAQVEMPTADAYTYAADVMVQNMMARDAAEGIGAFIEKRKPEWKGC